MLKPSFSTKRVVRKRVRKGTLTPGGSRGGVGGGSARNSGALFSFGGGGGRRSQPLGNGSQIASQLGQTVSFAEVEDPRSIHQRLGVVEKERKSSLVNSITRSEVTDIH